jgi:hypothetical protein
VTCLVSVWLLQGREKRKRTSNHLSPASHHCNNERILLPHMLSLLCSSLFPRCCVRRKPPRPPSLLPSSPAIVKRATKNDNRDRGGSACSRPDGQPLTRRQARVKELAELKLQGLVKLKRVVNDDPKRKL